MVVAISIPEGPYLPLAILTVHTLTAATLSHNNNNNSDDDGGDSSAPIPIMLPMDPEQGLDRLKHTLLDARPTLIPCFVYAEFVEYPTTLVTPR